MSKTIQWDWQSRLTDGERDLINGYDGKENSLQKARDEIDVEIEKVAQLRSAIIREAVARAKKAGVKVHAFTITARQL